MFTRGPVCSLLLLAALSAQGTALRDAIRGANALTAAGKPEEAVAILVKLVVDVPEECASPLLQGLLGAANALDGLGRPLRAIEAIESGLAVLRAHPKKFSPELQAAARGRAVVTLRSLRRFEEALDLSGEAIRILRELPATQAGSLLVEALRGRSEMLSELGRSVEALELADQALDACGPDAPDLEVERFRCLTHRAACLVNASRHPDAIEDFDRAERVRKRLGVELPVDELASHLSNRAACLVRLGRTEEAVANQQQALELTESQVGFLESEDHALQLNNLGQILFEHGELEEAESTLRKSIAMHERVFRGRDDFRLAITLLNLSRCQSKRGDLVSSRASAEASLAIAKDLGELESDFGAAAHGQLAMVLAGSGALREALDLARVAVATAKRIHPVGAHVRVAEAIEAEAEVLLLSGDAEAALKATESALEIWLEVAEGRDLVQTANCRLVLGDLLLAIGRTEAALAQKVEALSCVQRLSSGRPSFVLASHLLGVARVEAMIDPAQALRRCEEAEVARAAAFGDRLSPLDVSIAQSTSVLLRGLGRPEEARRASERALRVHRQLVGDVDDFTRLDLLATLAKAASSCGELDEAIDAAEEAAAAAERLVAVAGLDSPLARARLFDAIKDSGCFDVLQQCLAGRMRFADAFHALERARASALLDLLRSHGAESGTGSGIDGEANAKLAELTAERARLLGRLSRVQAGVLEENFAARLTANAARIRELTEEKRAELALGLVPASVKEIRASLRPKEALIEYSVTKEGAFMALVTRRAVLTFGVRAGRARVQEWVEALCPQGSVSAETGGRGRPVKESAPKGSRETAAKEAFAELVTKELWPSIENCERVFVAPHGPLHELPFEALVIREHEGRPVTWLEGGPPIAYIPSGSVLQHLRSRVVVPRPDGLDVLVLGNPSIEDVAADESMLGQCLRRLPNLRGAETEASTVGQLFGAGRAKVVLGREATKELAFESAAGARYLHFACHGILLDDGSARVSALVLANQRGTASQSGLLTFDELLKSWRSRLASTEMVVLSACRTDAGKVLRDEAPLALPMAFLLAGSRSVVATRWPIDDAITAELMTDFYRRLAAEPTDRLAAFVAARRGLRERHPDPRHWAAFHYFGLPD